MKTAFLLAMAALAALTGLAADAPLPPEIENEQLLNVGKEPPHATLMPYASVDQARGGKRRESPFARSLNGDWRFHWVARPEQRPVDFYKPEFDVSGWKTIPVPSCWQLQGYGTPYYRNAGYIFKNDPPHVMSEPPRDWTAYEERNPVGSYRRDFEVPAEWAGRRVFVTFDGVDSNLYLWVNGQRAGYSTNSRAPAEFDITPYLKAGQNVLAAEVYRFCAGSYLEDQDMWRLSGIFRNVTLWSAPAVHVRDFSVQTDLDASYKDAVVRIAAKVKNYGGQPVAARALRYQLYENGGQTAPVSTASADVPALAPGEERAVSLEIPVADPRKWTAETPELYTSVLTLTDPAAEPEILSCRTGFREIEIKEGVFHVNGVPVKLLGFNRHENEPDTGHTVSEESMMRDIRLLKGCNSNHVRTCHYQDDPRWYELCDEYGLYLVAESNLESHGSSFDRDRSLSYKPNWEKAHVQRQVDNVESNKNHASVVIWSLGNEAGGGPNFAAAAKAVKALDATRPVHYEGNSSYGDMESHMYTSPDGVAKWLREHPRTKPFYLCEYAHAMNNSMGGLQEYLDVINGSAGAMGGAIWEWQDQAIWNRRDPAKPFLAYGGGFGEKPNDGVFILKGGGVFADRTPNPKYFEVKHGYQWIKTTKEADKVTVHNAYAFTPLSAFRATWSVARDGREIAHGDLPLPEAAPGKSAALDVPLAADLLNTPGEYFLHIGYRFKKKPAWMVDDAEIAADQFRLGATPPSASAKTSPLQVTEEAGRIAIGGAKFHAIFDKTGGKLSELVYGGTPVIMPETSGLALYAYRAPHRDDDRWTASAWKAAGLDRLTFRPSSTEINRAADGTVQVQVSGVADGGKGIGFSQVVNYTVDGSGTIGVRVSALPRGRRIVLPRLGMRVLLNPALDHLTYYGRGPQENYPDRQLGAEIGCYASSVRDQLTPYVRPMECGNHGDARWCALTKGPQGEGARVTSLGGTFAFSALPYADEQLERAEYTHELPPSNATVLCLAARTLGVGTGSCGPSTFPAYRIYNEPTVFSFQITPATDEGASASAGLVVSPVLVRRDENAMVSLSNASPEAKISYALDNGELQPYTVPFAAREGRLRVRAIQNGALPFVGEFALDKLSSRPQWKVTASDFQPGEGDPDHATDGDPGTFWHSRYSPEAQGPHFLVLDIGKTSKISGLTYFAREDGNNNGRVREYEIYLSADGQNWGGPVSRGRFRNDAGEQKVAWPAPVAARYVKFVALSEMRGQPFASVAELDLTFAD